MREENRVRTPAISFIVRLWPDDECGPEMCGEVEYVRTGEKRLFGSDRTLLSIIDDWRQDLEVAS